MGPSLRCAAFAVLFFAVAACSSSPARPGDSTAADGGASADGGAGPDGGGAGPDGGGTRSDGGPASRDGGIDLVSDGGAPLCVAGTASACSYTHMHWTGSVCCVDGPVECLEGTA